MTAPPTVCSCCARRTRPHHGVTRDRCKLCRGGCCDRCRPANGRRKFSRKQAAVNGSKGACATPEALARLIARAAAKLPLFGRRNDRPCLPVLLDGADERGAPS